MPSTHTYRGVSAIRAWVSLCSSACRAVVGLNQQTGRRWIPTFFFMWLLLDLRNSLNWGVIGILFIEMTNKLKFLGLLMVVTIGLVSVSCGGDDDESPEAKVKRQLIGIWSTTIQKTPWEVIEIREDGKVQYSLKENKDGTVTPRIDNHFANWVYSESNKTITMFTDDYYYNFAFEVNMSDDGSLWNGTKLSDGKVYLFRRINAIHQ